MHYQIVRPHLWIVFCDLGISFETYLLFSRSSHIISHGCSTVCGGTERSTMWFDVSYSKASMDLWDSWLSTMSNAGVSYVGFTYFTKKDNHSTNSAVFIHPESEHDPMEPGGATFIRRSTIRFFEKMRAGGMNLPSEVQQHIAVTVFPLSALAMNQNLSFTFHRYDLGRSICRSLDTSLVAIIYVLWAKLVLQI